MAKPTKETAKTPKVEYISIERREPTKSEQEMVLDAAVKAGVRPGFIGVLANHESAGTWHPEIRPRHPDEPPLKITTTGEVIGKPGTTATGIGQWLETRWFLDMYKHGEELIRNAELDKHNPDAVKTIRAANKMIQAELGNRKPDWANMDKVEGKLDSTPEGKALHKLRSDPSNRIPIHMLAINISDYAAELKSFGLPATAQNIYGTHHTSAADVAKYTRKADYVPGEDSKFAAAVALNGSVFAKADGTLKTGTETMAQYGLIMSEGLSARFERQYYGRDFGPDEVKPRALKGADGKTYNVRPELITPRASVSQFTTLWRQPVVNAEKPENLASAVAGFERLGYDFGKARPEGFENTRLKAAITSFKHQAGLPFADKGEFDANAQRYLQLAVQNADKYIGLQQQQMVAAAQPNQLNLRTIGKDLKALPKDSPVHEQVRSVVVGVKQQLVVAGIIEQPTKMVTYKDEAGKKRRREEPVAFDGSIDKKLLSALSTYQREQGLADTKGVLERVTMGRLYGGKQPVIAPVPAPAASQPAQAKPATPAVPAAPANPRVSTGSVKVSDATEASPSRQFAALSPSNSVIAVRKVSLTAEGSHVAPHVASYGTSLRKGNKQFDERVYEAQRLLERTGHGKLLGAAGADGIYGEGTDKAFAAYAAAKNVSKKPGEVGEELLTAMRQDRVQLAASGRTPEFFERYLASFGAPAPSEAPQNMGERLRSYSGAYPNVISSQLRDPSQRWGKTEFGITANADDYKMATRLLVERGHLDANDLTAKDAPQRAIAALKEYQGDIGLIPTGRLDRATFVSVEQTLYPNAVMASTPSRMFNQMGEVAQVNTATLTASLEPAAESPAETQRLRNTGPRLQQRFTQG